MSCEHTRQLAAELALGIADGADRARALQHLGECAECRRAVEELSGVTDELLMLAPERQPPVGFESRVLARLQPAADAPPAAPAPPRPAARSGVGRASRRRSPRRSSSARRVTIAASPTTIAPRWPPRTAATSRPRGCARLPRFPPAWSTATAARRPGSSWPSTAPTARPPTPSNCGWLPARACRCPRCGLTRERGARDSPFPSISTTSRASASSAPHAATSSRPGCPTRVSEVITLSQEARAGTSRRSGRPLVAGAR